MTTYTASGSKKSEKKKTGAVQQSTAPAKYTYNASENEAYTKATADLSAARQKTPQYKGTYDGALRDLYGEIANREPFRFDLNEDKLYEQYRDRYALAGAMAMRDTVGQAAALTGGYGSTYAQAVGGQAYDAYLQQLNDVIPDLYGLALDRYNAEGDRLVQRYGVLSDLADTEYARYETDLNDYWQNVGYLQQQANTAYDRGYENFLSAYEMNAAADRFTYEKEQDALDRQTEADRFTYEKEQDALDRQTEADRFTYEKEQDTLDRQTEADRFTYEKEQDALDRQTEADRYTYTQSVDADTDRYERQLAAYDRLAELITTTGYTPTADDLTAAGMTKAQADAYRSVYTQKNVKKSAGGGTSGTKKQTTEEKTETAKPENTVLSESEWSRQKAELLRNDPTAMQNKRSKAYKTFAGSYRDYLLRNSK